MPHNDLPARRGEILVRFMARAPARFRISIKDKLTGRAVKIELIDAPGLWGERRYRIRVDGRDATRIKEATLTEIFDRLRRWVVTRAAAPTPNAPPASCLIETRHRSQRTGSPDTEATEQTEYLAL